MALCLSGGGYRAMVFHVGALWRLYEAEPPPRTQAHLQCFGRLDHRRRACAELESKLSFDPHQAAVRISSAGRGAYPRACRRNDRRQRDHLSGLLLPGRVSDRSPPHTTELLSTARPCRIFRTSRASCINATNVQSGVLWRFMKPYMARLSRRRGARSRRFPWLAGRRRLLGFPAGALAVRDCGSTERLHARTRARIFSAKPYTSRVILSDGGVTTISAWRRPGSAMTRFSSATAAASSRRRRSLRPTGRSIPIAC